jgi:thiosulfate dehydrogenase [quinone] large subunit
MDSKRIERFEEPKAAKWLFASTAAAWIWIAPRLYFGWKWFEAGREKIWPAEGAGWLTDPSGLKGFVGYAQTLATGEHPAVNYDWYVSFLKFVGNNADWMAPLIAIGELLIGLAFIAGLFVGVSAFFAGMLNMSFGLAGSAGVNPLFFLFDVLLILAWRNAGYWGLDRFALPILGTPWEKGTLFEHRTASA